MTVTFLMCNLNSNAATNHMGTPKKQPSTHIKQTYSCMQNKPDAICTQITNCDLSVIEIEFAHWRHISTVANHLFS